MQITSNAVGGSTHVLSDAAQHDATNSSPESALLRQGIIIVGGAPATEDKGKGVAGPTENITLNYGQVSLAYAQQNANGTGVNPQPPTTTSSSMASFVPTGGLHPFAVDTTKGSVDTNAQRAGKPNPGKMNFEHYFDKASVGGLHPVAGGQATATAMDVSDVAVDILNAAAAAVRLGVKTLIHLGEGTGDQRRPGDRPS